MKNVIKKSLQAMLLVPVLSLGLAFTAGVVSTPTALAAECSGNDISGGISSGAQCSQGTGQSSDLFGETGIFKTVTNVLLFIIGAISVIMLIIGGIRYVVSAGDSAAVTGAKNTILYAIVGILVALLAFAAVNFVLDSFVAE